METHPQFKDCTTVYMEQTVDENRGYKAGQIVVADFSKNVKGRSIRHIGYKEHFKGHEKRYVATKMVSNSVIEKAKFVTLCKINSLAAKATDILERPHALGLRAKFCYKAFTTSNAHNIVAKYLGLTKITGRKNLFRRNKVFFRPPRSQKVTMKAAKSFLSMTNGCKIVGKYIAIEPSQVDEPSTYTELKFFNGQPCPGDSTLKDGNKSP